MGNVFQWIPFLLVAGFWIYLFIALLTGRMRAGRSLNTRLIDRREQPVRFWISWLAMAAVLVIFSTMLVQYSS